MTFSLNLSPQIKLYFGILSISFFPIVFYFFSQKANIWLCVFLLFIMVSLLSFPAAVNEVYQKSSSSGSVMNYLRKIFTLRIISILILISCITILGNLLVFNSLSHNLSPSIVQTILRSETVFVSIGGVLIFKEYYPSTLPWVIALIIVALAFMSYESLIKKQWHWNDIYILHVLVSTLCFGGFQIISKFIIHDLSIYFLNGVRAFICALIILPLAYTHFSEITGEILLFAALSALAGPFLGRNVILSCTRDLPLNYIGCHLSLTPIFSLGLEWLLIHTSPSRYEIIGGTILIFSILLFNLSKTKSTS